jgi:hypothetical protein
VKLLKLFIAAVALGGMVVAYLLFTGPHMKNQPSLKDYEALPPPLPAGATPVNPLPGMSTVPDSASNPLPATPVNLARGKVYYGYYCLFCHGEKGNGEGPVGDSYVPKPADLNADSIRTLTDRALYTAMLIGVGHEPVLARVVAPEHRWYLVLFVREFAAGTDTLAGKESQRRY